MTLGFLDWIGDVAWAGLIYHTLNNLPGLVLIVLATLGVLVFLWKHNSDKNEYRFSFRKAVDLWAMTMISAAFGAGVWLMVSG